jgi:hypothetical protein
MGNCLRARRQENFERAHCLKRRRNSNIAPSISGISFSVKRRFHRANEGYFEYIDFNAYLLLCPIKTCFHRKAVPEKTSL